MLRRAGVLVDKSATLHLLHPRQTTHRLPLTTLLIEKLRRLSHSQPNNLILPTLPIFFLPTCKHLQRLHGSRVTHVLRISLLASLVVAIEVLVLLDGIVLVDIFVLELRLLA